MPVGRPMLVGAPVRRKEDPPLLTGYGRYVDDIVLPRMGYAAFVRSTHPHAWIRGVETRRAEALQRVLTVMTARDMEGQNKFIPSAATEQSTERYMLAVDKVRYVGEPVAMVVAETRTAAEDALDMVDVEYERLPHVTDVEAATAADAPILHEQLGSNVAEVVRKQAGDIEGAFQRADKVVQRRLAIQRVAAVAMEPRGIVASFDRGVGSLTVWQACQSPHVMRTWISKFFGIPENRMRVVAPDVGGAFGTKGNLYSDELATCYAAMQLGRPVKWVENRLENLTSTVHGRDQVHYIQCAVKRDGSILGLRDKLFADLGAYHHFFSASVSSLTLDAMTGNYNVTNLALELYKVFTNKMSIESYRAAGRGESTYVVERMIDEVARELRLDPAEVRMRNFITKDAFPYITATGLRYDTGAYHEALDQALSLLEYTKLRKNQRGSDQRKRLGVGLAAYVMIGAWGPSKDLYPDFAGYESATVRFDPSGRVTIFTGTASHGQGNDTIFAQIVADEFGLNLDDVTVLHGDTSMVPYGSGTHGSRACVVGGHAVLAACKRIKEKATRIAAYFLKTDAKELEFREGRVQVKTRPGQTLSLEDIAREAYFMKALPPAFEPGLEATAIYEPTGMTSSFGVDAAVVEVDLDTGAVKITKFVSVDDCGKAVNPLIVDGQIHGGIAQGIGQALYEQVLYDQAGQPVTRTLLDYLTPTATEVPDLLLRRTVTPSLTALAAKGMGEAGNMASTAAVANAIADALAPFGVADLATPLSPHAIWAALRGGRSTRTP